MSNPNLLVELNQLLFHFKITNSQSAAELVQLTIEQLTRNQKEIDSLTESLNEYRTIINRLSETL